MDEERVRRRMRRYVAVLAVPFVLYGAWIIASSADEGWLLVAIDRWFPAIAGAGLGVATLLVWTRTRR